MTTGIGSGDSPQRRTKVRFAHISRKAVLGMAALGLAGGAAFAAPQAAMASGPSCSGTCTGTVSGSVTISTTLALTLSGTSFTLTNVAPGVEHEHAHHEPDHRDGIDQ